MAHGGELPRVELDYPAISSATTGALTFGERGAEAGESAYGTGVLEPIMQGIGRLMVALSELLDSPATTGTVRLGGIELEYQALHRAHGSVRLRHRADTGFEASYNPPVPGVGSAGDGAAPHRGDDRGRAWERGVAAAHDGEHARALGLYEQEAQVAAREGAHGRAAIAYRSASGQADRVGRHDEANRLLRLAGKHYLHVAESPGASIRGIRQAYEVAAKCFLQAGNLELTLRCVSQAMALDEALGVS